MAFYVNLNCRFNNGPCGGASNINGTCYTASECEAKGGTNAGACAAGYGVCCTCKYALFAQRGNFIVFLSLRFYVKSILGILKVQNLPF